MRFKHVKAAALVLMVGMLGWLLLPQAAPLVARWLYGAGQDRPAEWLLNTIPVEERHWVRARVLLEAGRCIDGMAPLSMALSASDLDARLTGEQEELEELLVDYAVCLARQGQPLPAWTFWLRVREMAGEWLPIPDDVLADMVKVVLTVDLGGVTDLEFVEDTPYARLMEIQVMKKQLLIQFKYLWPEGITEIDFGDARQWLRETDLPGFGEYAANLAAAIDMLELLRAWHEHGYEHVRERVLAADISQLRELLTFPQAARIPRDDLELLQEKHGDIFVLVALAGYAPRLLADLPIADTVIEASHEVKAYGSIDWSADGRWLLYYDSRDARVFSGDGSKVFELSDDEIYSVYWAPEGSGLAYLTKDFAPTTGVRSRINIVEHPGQPPRRITVAKNITLLGWEDESSLIVSMSQNLDRELYLLCLDEEKFVPYAAYNADLPALMTEQRRWAGPGEYWVDISEAKLSLCNNDGTEFASLDFSAEGVLLAEALRPIWHHEGERLLVLWSDSMMNRTWLLEPGGIRELKLPANVIPRQWLDSNMFYCELGPRGVMALIWDVERERPISAPMLGNLTANPVTGELVWTEEQHNEEGFFITRYLHFGWLVYD